MNERPEIAEKRRPDDRRVRKTKTALKKALTTLLLEKSINSISVKELTDMAVGLFIGMVDTPVVPLSGGGGSNDESPWGRKEDEDDREWARRCARMAVRCMGRKPKSGYRR